MFGFQYIFSYLWHPLSTSVFHEWFVFTCLIPHIQNKNNCNSILCGVVETLMKLNHLIQIFKMYCHRRIQGLMYFFSLVTNFLTTLHQGWYHSLYKINGLNLWCQIRKLLIWILKLHFGMKCVYCLHKSIIYSKYFR